MLKILAITGKDVSEKSQQQNKTINSNLFSIIYFYCLSLLMFIIFKNLKI